jgi:hypothetical protein
MHHYVNASLETQWKLADKSIKVTFFKNDFSNIHWKKVEIGAKNLFSKANAWIWITGYDNTLEWNLRD